MKRYYNPTTQEWYYEGRSMTRQLEDGSLFSGIPTEEQLLSWGFEEYVEPTPTPEEELAIAKENKKMEISDYDRSDSVNDFIFHGKHMWLAPDIRSNYMLTIEGAKRLGVAVVPFLGIEIPVDNAQTMLDMINVYAMQCVAVTEAHKAAVDALDTVEAVEAYDYTTGYPEKVNFDELAVQ